RPPSATRRTASGLWREGGGSGGTRSLTRSQGPGRAAVRLAPILGLLVQVTGCTVGPDYARPPVGVPAAYKELDGWKGAQPSDGVLRGAWWELFADPQLPALEG